MHQLYLPEPTTVTLTDANPRKESHGDEDVNALDLTMELEYTAEHFDQLFVQPKEIQKAFFKGGEVIENRFKPLKFDDAKTKDQRFSIDGIGYTEMVFRSATCTLKHAEPRNGPVMAVKFGVAVYPEVHEIGPLCDMVHQHVEITLIEGQGDVEDAAGEETEDQTDAVTESSGLSVVGGQPAA